MRIAVIGAGRLGRSLSLLLAEAGHAVEVCGRDAMPQRPELVFLCVPDHAIAGVARRVPAGPVVLHCSGSCGLAELAPHHPRGSLHPLMTFPGPEVAMPPPGAPAAVAGDPEAVAVARAIAIEIGWRPFEVSGDRALYHCAAVMAGNFGTVLLAAASDVLAAAGADPQAAPGLLAPLALASIHNAAIDPVAALTGPFARGDEGVIAAHRAALAALDEPELLQVYDALAQRARRLAHDQRARKSPGG